MDKNKILEIINANFEDAVEVEINDEIYEICRDFAEKVNPTTKYGDCGQNNMNKRLIDNLIGKIAEFSTYAILNKIGRNNEFILDMPDISIYKGRQKTWKSDLSIKADDGEINIAVKSQSVSQAKKYSLSGTFQISATRSDKVFEKQDELIFLCLVDDINNDGKKTLILPPKTIGNIKFSDPKLPKYKGVKTCYYARENFEEETLQTWLDKFGAEKVK